MRVHFTIERAEHHVDIEETDDLKFLCDRIETELRILCPEVNKDDYLVVTITDGVLNSLADDQDEISLGELLGTKP